MPVSVIVGGQYGSEGKGKIALYTARQKNATAVVRVGGSNSGHTGIDEMGVPRVLRQLPASCMARDTLVVLPAGSLIDPDILLAEIAILQLDPSRLIIDSQATIVLPDHREREALERLQQSIGSTGSGTGAALRERLSRQAGHSLVSHHPQLRRFVVDFVPSVLRKLLDANRRIVIEGTQGFGLSIWHGGHFPYATSRDTTAAGFLSETGLAPQDVDDIVLVLRAFPIRVGGNSGPLANEIDWPTLADEAGLPSDYCELTSATHRVRRVARFDPQIVKRAITVNRPHRIALNHLDYVGKVQPHSTSSKVNAFITEIESSIGQSIDLLGFGPDSVAERKSPEEQRRKAHGNRTR